MDASVDRDSGGPGDQPDALSPDAGRPQAMDAAVPRDAGMDAANSGSVDASDAAPLRDAGKVQPSAADSGASDAGSRDAGATQPGSSDAGPSDAGSMDASTTSAGPCVINVTMNTYVGQGHYHGYLSIANAGSTIWTLITIEFDLPVNTYYCNDEDILPGTGWALLSSAGHCAYTKTAPGLSIQPGATLSFEYSSNYANTRAEPAVAQVKVSGCR